MAWNLLPFFRSARAAGPKVNSSSRHRPGLEALEDRLAPAVLPPGFTESSVAGGLSAATAFELSPDNRVFVAEQAGALKVFQNGSLLQANFFRDTPLTVDANGERGLLGIAFDPGYAQNHFVYVYYTATSPAVHNRVSRFTAGATGDLALPGSETVLLDLDNLSTATNHNGGALHFGPDGKLYVGAGENANGANSQTLANLLGKVLRINPDGTIPADNPFYNTAAGKDRAIWALGLRNPFSFAFQPGTGRMFIDDVGAGSFEEIDEGRAGANYGWPVTEGPTSDPRFVGPLYAYDHTQGTAITGGAFYNPAAPQFPPGLTGDYFFTDLGGNWIRQFDPTTGSVSTFATGLSSPVGLRVGPEGSLYYLNRDTGQVFRVRFTGPPMASTPGVFDPGSGRWYLRGSNSSGPPDVQPPFAYGLPGWVPVTGDWNGDGQTSVGVFDPSGFASPGAGVWYLRNSNSGGPPDVTPFPYGARNWIPVAGDWNGDGTTTVGAFDPATATWYLRDSNSPGSPDVAPFVYGLPGWVPVVGDWDGDGTTTIGVVDPATMTWYLRDRNSAGVPDVRPFAYGGAGWRPVVGDWDGDGRMTVAVVDPRGTWYLRNRNSAGAPDVTPFPYGLGGWDPVAGSWNLPALALLPPEANAPATGGSHPPDSPAPLLTPTERAGIGSATLTGPGNSGPAPAPRQTLASARVEVGPLGSGVLGLPFRRTNRVVFSPDGAGYGYLV